MMKARVPLRFFGVKIESTALIFLYVLRYIKDITQQDINAYLPVTQGAIYFNKNKKSNKISELLVGSQSHCNLFDFFPAASIDFSVDVQTPKPS